MGLTLRKVCLGSQATFYYMILPLHYVQRGHNGPTLDISQEIRELPPLRRNQLENQNGFWIPSNKPIHLGKAVVCSIYYTPVGFALKGV